LMSFATTTADKKHNDNSRQKNLNSLYHTANSSPFMPFKNDYPHQSLQPGSIKPKSLCSCEGNCPRCSIKNIANHVQSVVQAKLKVSQPGDEYELEADRVADWAIKPVSDWLAPLTTAKKRVVDIVCMACKTDKNMTNSENRVNGLLSLSAIKRLPYIDDKNENIQIQKENSTEIARLSQNELMSGKDFVSPRYENDDIYTTKNFETNLNNSKGRGQPMPEPIRSEMQLCFGRNFNNIRIHGDSSAIQMCEQVNAYAFTHGKDIYFNEGKFNPNTKEGKYVLAHELTHTIQQGDERIQRMTIKKYGDLDKFGCGGMSVSWSFELDKPALSDGYFVQLVTFLPHLESCPSSVTKKEYMGYSLVPKIRYFEAWPVKKDKKKR